MGGAILCFSFAISIISNKYNFMSLFNLNMTLKYFFWFFLGYLIKLNYRHLRIVMLVLILASIVFLHYSNILYSIIIIVTIWQLMPHCKNSVCLFLDKQSFGIYLLHSPLVYITYMNFTNESPMSVFMLNFFVWGGLATVISYYLSNSQLSFIVGKSSQNKII